jgi:response regulator RpfG family c-di-GMP phosphodiesterase
VATDVVLGMMRDTSGAHFDPNVLQAFFDRLPDVTAIHEEHAARA